MPTILACTDGSTYASSVYQHAAWAAARLSARVEVLHVLDHHRERASHLDLSGSIGIDASSQLIEELTKLEEAEGRVARLKGKAILDDARHQLAAVGMTDVTATQRHGTLVETLVELEPRCDLVVVGERGEDAEVAKAHLGRNLERVIRTAVRPILVVERTYRPISSFLIAYDGSPSVTKALDFALLSPLLKGATCHILRTGQVDDKAKWYLNEAADKLRAANYTVTSHAIAGAPEKVILDVLQREQIDLLVMGAYGHGRIRELILGSTTTTMVRTSPVSVLMFR
jgi:nucleotide-binding universal stress UspA family protein